MAAVWLQVSDLVGFIFLCVSVISLCLNYFRCITGQNVPEFSSRVIGVTSIRASDCEFSQVEPLCEGIP